MNHPPANSFNTNLALGLLVVGAVLFVILLILLYLVPEPTLSQVDKVSIKAILLGLGFLTISSIGVFLYWTFHTPTVRRLTLTGWRAIIVYSAIAGGFSVFGWPRVKSLNLAEDTGLMAEFASFEASLEVWPNLAVCFAGIVAMTIIYIAVGVLEAKFGKEI